MNYSTSHLPGPGLPGQNGGAPIPADRREFKFLVDVEVRDRMLPDIATRLLVDPHSDEDGAYHVATVYYDSAERDVYWERSRHVIPRHKLRLRRYGDGLLTDAACFVEIKTRLRRRVVKRRLPVSVEEGLALCSGVALPGSFQPADKSVIDDVLGLVSLRDLQPACLVRYRRQAFVGAENLRLTFDSGLTYRIQRPTVLSDTTAEGALLPAEQVVMEIKVADAVPTWLATLVARHGGVLRRFSKYCQAVEVAGLLDQPLPHSEAVTLG